MSERAERDLRHQALRQLRIPCPRLIGREEELLWLQERLKEAREGRGDLVFLVGEAGVGKSRLLTELMVQWQHTGILRLEGKCSLFEAHLPYAPLVEAFRGLLRGRTRSAIARLLGPYAPEAMKILPEVAQLIPDIPPNPPLAPPEERSRLFESLYQVLHKMAAQDSLVLALEDIHWADPASLDFLHFIARRLRHDRWLVVVTYRPEELVRAAGLNQLRRDLFRERLAQELTVRPFGSTQTRELITEVLSGGMLASEPLAAWIFHCGEGNPFFTEEILRAIAEASDGRIDDLQSATLSTVSIPSTVREAILVRLHQLTPEARRILNSAAALGRTFDLETLQEVSGLAGEAFTQPIAGLLSVQLLRTERTPLRYGFHHHLIREVVVESLAPDLRRDLHRRIGLLLEARQAPAATPQTLAHHFMEAGEGERTLRYALAAGFEASKVHAYEEAAQSFALALDMIPAATSERLAVAEHLGDALLHAGHLDRAVEAFTTMHQCAEALGMYREQARAYRKMGQAQNEKAAGRGLGAFEKGLALLAVVDDPYEEAMIREQASSVAFQMGRYPQGEVEAQAAIAAAERAQDPGALSRSYKTLARHLVVLRRFGEAREYEQKALALARQAGDLEAECRSLAVVGESQHVFDAVFDEARATLERACELAEKLGGVPSLLLPQALLCRLDLYQGRWKEAEALSVRLTARLSQGAERHWPFAFAAAVLGYLYLLQGRYDEAEALLQEGRTAAEAGSDTRVLALILNRLAQLELRKGKPAVARMLLERAVEINKSPGFGSMSLGLLSQVWLQLGDPGAARTFAEKADGEGKPLRIHHAIHACYLGQVAAQEGNLDEATDHYQSGLDVGAVVPQPYVEALLRYNLGLCLLRRSQPGDRKAGRAHLTAALAILERLGAEPDAENVRQALRRISGRAPAGHNLTEREQEVLALLAQGLSNAAIAGRLYISERTVAVHVSRILDKLGVENRIQAAARASESA